MKKTILIVDDEEPVRHMIRRLIEAKGYEIAEANSAETGFKTACEIQPDLVITDMKMPGKDGLWLAQELLARDPHLPILLVTAYADLQSARQAVSIGIYEYFTKPVDMHQILASIQRGLENRRLALENKDYQLNLEQKVEDRTQALEDAYRELVQAEKLSEVGRLAAGVVHEVLNPLSVVKGRIEMVLMGNDLNEMQERSLGIAQEQLDRAVKIMDNLRDFSRQRPPHRTLEEVNPLIAHTIELLVHEIKQNNIEVQTDFNGLPEIMIDSDQFCQVWLNLIRNAIDAMEGGGVLKISTETIKLRNQSGVKVSISDTGIGISQENLDHIFDLFFTTKKNGTGLGLGICRGIVESHGGILGVESQAGKGTTISIELPQDGQKSEQSVFEDVSNKELLASVGA